MKYREEITDLEAPPREIRGELQQRQPQATSRCLCLFCHLIRNVLALVDSYAPSFKTSPRYLAALGVGSNREDSTCRVGAIVNYEEENAPLFDTPTR